MSNNFLKNARGVFEGTQSGMTVKEACTNYGMNDRQVQLACDYYNAVIGNPPLFHPEADVGGLFVYNSVEGLGGMAKTSRVRLARDYGLSRHAIDRLYYTGMGNSVFLAKEEELKSKVSSLQISEDDRTHGYADLDPEVILQVQREYQESGNVGVTSSKFGLPKEIVEELINLKVEKHENDVWSISKHGQAIQSLVPGTLFETKDSCVTFMLLSVSIDEGWALVRNCVNKKNQTIEFGEDLMYVVVTGCDEDYADRARLAARAEICGRFVFQGETVSVFESSDSWKTGILMTSVGPLSVEKQEGFADHSHENHQIFENYRLNEISVESSESGKFDHSGVKPTNSNPNYRVVTNSFMVNVIDVVSGKQFIATRNHNSFAEICGHLEAGEIEKAIEIIEGSKKLRFFEGDNYRWAEGDEEVTILVDGEEFKWKGSSSICNRLEEFAEKDQKFGFEIMDKFVGNCLENPSGSIFEKIPNFMRFGDVQLNEDGMLVCYKAVNERYRDDFTDSIDNSPGSVVKMKRVLIDENPNNTCSRGLHVCSLDYVNRMSIYGKPESKIVMVCLNPRDIVAIPNDYEERKIRCCLYSSTRDVTREYQRGELQADVSGAFSIRVTE